MRCLVFLLLWSMLLVGCGFDEGFDAPPPPDTLTGEWQGTWTSHQPRRVTGDLTLVLHATMGQELTGTLTLHGACLQGAMTFAVTMEGVSLSGEGQSRAGRVVLFGELDREPPAHLLGQYHVLTGRCAGEAGQWTAERE